MRGRARDIQEGNSEGETGGIQAAGSVVQVFTCMWYLAHIYTGVYKYTHIHTSSIYMYKRVTYSCILIGGLVLLVSRADTPLSAPLSISMFNPVYLRVQDLVGIDLTTPKKINSGYVEGTVDTVSCTIALNQMQSPMGSCATT
jgi:hypothetical protein